MADYLQVNSPLIRKRLVDLEKHYLPTLQVYIEYQYYHCNNRNNNKYEIIGYNNLK